MVNVGKRLYGFCEGHFLVDDYHDKIIVYENDYCIVCKQADVEDLTNPKHHWLNVCYFSSVQDKQSCIDRWSVDSVDPTECC